MINIKSCYRFLIIFISLIVVISADDGDFFLSSFDAEPSTSSSELYAVGSFSRRSLLAVDNVKTSESLEIEECWKCKVSARTDCIGLSDKTAYCICTEFFFEGTGKVPAVCKFAAAKADRQKSCQKHNCPSKKKCIDYAQKENEKQMTCVCPEGRFRGDNCADKYQLINQIEGLSCVETVSNGKICMCNVYGNGKIVGFCKIGIGNVAASISTTDQCGAEVKCKNRGCFKFGDKGLVCTCPIDNTGPDCGQKSLACSACKKEDIKDCIGLLDGTARCICISPGNGKDPEICYFPKSLPDRQADCLRKKKKVCDPGQQCVNYAQQSNVVQITCQCPVGNKRGQNCQESYSRIEPGEETSCVQIVGQTPICICNKYGMTPGFCKPMVATDTSDQSNVVKNPCEGRSNQCRSGKCYETEEANGRNFYCVCSLKKSGKYCHQKIVGCGACKSPIDCLGLPDGTAICVCMEFLAGLGIETPTICHFFSKPKEISQTECKAGKHNCKGNEVCVNYAQEKNEKAKVCQCPLGRKRGPWCDKDFDAPNPAKSFSCVDTSTHGVLCVCDAYMAEPVKFGFCSADPVNNKFAGSRQTGLKSPVSVPLPLLYESTRSESKTTQTTQTRLEPAPDLQDLLPCSSNPCQNNGLCRLNPALKSSDFVCACPVVNRQAENCNDIMPDCSNVKCINMTECLMWPSEAECICDEEFRKFVCTLKKKNVTEWEKLKQIITPESSNTTEQVVLICVAVLINALPICLICHCCRVSSARKKYKAKYDEVVNEGKTPNAPLPAWFDVSNDLVQQTLCCGTSKLPQTFEGKKRKKKKDKKDKQKTEENDAEENKEDLNENSPLQKFGGMSSFGHVRWNDRVRRYSALNSSSITNLKLKLAQNNNRNSTGSKHNYIREYIKSQRSYPRNVIREKLISRDDFGDEERIPCTRAYFDDDSIKDYRYSYSGDCRLSKSSFR